MSEIPKLSDLIARLEMATGPDRVLDGRIKLAIAASMFANGRTKDEAVSLLNGDLYDDPLPYTGSHDAALTAIPDGLSWSGGDLNQDDTSWCCLTGEDGVDYAATAPTVPIAICTAAITALKAHSLSESSTG